METLKKAWNWLLGKTTIDEKIKQTAAEIKKEVAEVKVAVAEAINGKVKPEKLLSKPIDATT